MKAFCQLDTINPFSPEQPIEGGTEVEILSWDYNDQECLVRLANGQELYIPDDRFAPDVLYELDPAAPRPATKSPYRNK